MTEPTADDLARWAEEHRPVSWGLCGYCEDEEWPCATTRLLALVAAQAEQIAGLRAALDVAETQANNHAEVAILLERAVKRVRALCDEYEQRYGAERVQIDDIRAALDGTEATP